MAGMTIDMMQLRAAPVEITTARLVLRESDPAFAQDFADAIRSSHDSLEFVAAWRDAADVEVAALSLERSRQRADEVVVRHAFERSTGRYVARLDLHSWDFETPRCEVGFIADARLTGSGLAREAALAMIELAWTMGAERVQALVDARNTRARHFTVGLGLVEEGVLRSYERDDAGALCDQVMYAALNPASTANSRRT